MIETSAPTAPLVVAHAVATLTMVGLSWTVHVVHYPLFVYVDRERYPFFQQAHQRRISALLVLPWATEGLSALALVVLIDRGWPAVGVRVGAVAMLAILVVTVAVAVPAHERLGRGFDAEVHRRLLRADLARTILWSLRGGIAVALLVALVDSAATV